MQKVARSSAEAIEGIPDGAVIMFGGFGLCGIPENLIRALLDRNVRELTVISNNPGSNSGKVGKGLDLLFQRHQVRKFVGSFFGSAQTCKEQYLAGQVEIEIMPQGTLVERIRAAGAGIGGFYTAAGVGTIAEDGKERRRINGVDYLFELPLPADFAIVKAHVGDHLGNLVYHHTAQNFNPVMAKAATTTIAEVEQLVEPGELDPNHVHTPSIYVHRILKGEHYEKCV